MKLDPRGAPFRASENWHL